MSIRIISTGSIEGRPSFGLIGRKLGMYPIQIKNRSDLTNWMIARYRLVQAE